MKKMMFMPMVLIFSLMAMEGDSSFKVFINNNQVGIFNKSDTDLNILTDCLAQKYEELDQNASAIRYEVFIRNSANENWRCKYTQNVANIKHSVYVGTTEHDLDQQRIFTQNLVSKGLKKLRNAHQFNELNIRILQEFDDFLTNKVSYFPLD